MQDQIARAGPCRIINRARLQAALGAELKRKGSSPGRVVGQVGQMTQALHFARNFKRSILSRLSR